MQQVAVSCQELCTCKKRIGFEKGKVAYLEANLMCRKFDVFAIPNAVVSLLQGP